MLMMLGIDHGIDASLELGFVVFHTWLVEWIHAGQIAAHGAGFFEEIDQLTEGEGRKFADVEQDIRRGVFLVRSEHAVANDIVEAVQTGAAAGNALPGS